ncbi:D-2-hydroxyacid dehydrogenase [Rhodobacteraceae bacterium]|nr:D-2-hydroxyacid dehydrogenase [Paracoccaceae bacterium]
MTRIVFLDRATIAPQIALPRPAFAHEWVNHDHTAPDQTGARLATAKIAITNKVRITEDVLRAAPDLELVAVAATGYDCVDLDACAARGVVVCNIRGYSINTVPEHVFALLLGLRRNISAYARDVQNGRWQAAGQFCFFDHPIRDLSGAVMGIVGHGAIGTRVGALAQAFGMEVIYAARPDQNDHEAAQAGRVAWPDFCARADVISLHCPLTPATKGLLDRARFAQMTRRPIIVNTARGALIDLPALRDALAAGQVSAAGLDVACHEPPHPDDLLMELARDPRVIVTPHVAWASDEAQTALCQQMTQVLEGFMAGTPINRL